MTKEEKIYDIKERCLRFAVRIVCFVDRLPKSIAGYEIARQLLRAGTSAGANVEEADRAVSKKDFVNKIGTAGKEARGSNYWLRVIDQSNLLNKQDNKELTWLLNESKELTKILSSIMSKAKRN